MAERQATAMQFYESMALVVSAAFGKGQGGQKPKVAQTKAEIMAGMQEMFSKDG